MVKKICIIGYGSIGQKHYKILSKLVGKKSIFIYSTRIIKSYNVLNTLRALRDLEPDYFIISNQTSLHLKFLKYINNNFRNKIILCEKPLYTKYFNLKLKNNNKIFVGYNLRYDPIIQELVKLIKNKKIYNVNICCNSYLPKWRNRNYIKTSSSKINSGGGVLFDLSHEIDYANLLFGPIRLHNYVYKKLSSLKIETKDYFNGNFFNKDGISINIDLNYFSIKESRFIKVYGNNFYLHADLLSRKILYTKNKITKIKKVKKVNTYLEMHKDIIKNKNKYICDFENGLHFLKIIKNIK